MEFGKGYTVTNLKYMRQFYNAFPKRHALRDQLSWTHYRMLLKVENDAARMFYLDECTKSNWSTRQLERQINKPNCLYILAQKIESIDSAIETEELKFYEDEYLEAKQINAVSKLKDEREQYILELKKNQDRDIYIYGVSDIWLQIPCRQGLLASYVIIITANRFGRFEESECYSVITGHYRTLWVNNGQ